MVLCSAQDLAAKLNPSCEIYRTDVYASYARLPGACACRSAAAISCLRRRTAPGCSRLGCCGSSTPGARSSSLRRARPASTCPKTSGCAKARTPRTTQRNHPSKESGVGAACRQRHERTTAGDAVSRPAFGQRCAPPPSRAAQGRDGMHRETMVAVRRVDEDGAHEALQSWLALKVR